MQNFLSIPIYQLTVRGYYCFMGHLMRSEATDQWCGTDGYFRWVMKFLPLRFKISTNVLLSVRSIWKNQVQQTGFLVYFELDFYCLCSLQIDFCRLKLQLVELDFSNLIFFLKFKKRAKKQCISINLASLSPCFKKSSLKNQAQQTGFLVYFKLDFYCLCGLQKSSSKQT